MASERSTKTRAASLNKAKRRPEVIAERIRQVIQTDGLQPGDRLPQEKDLIDQFKAAKGTVREAMKALETQGLLFTRTGPGGGVFVAEPSTQHAMEMLGNYFFFDQPSLQEIYAIRKLLEPEIAVSLAGRLSNDDLEKLESTMRFYDRPPTNLDDQFQQRVAELDFHTQLAQLCPNRLLGFMCGVSHNLLRNMPVARAIYADPTPASREEGLLFQHRLLTALMENRVEDARKIALEHMISAEKYMLSKENELKKAPSA
ncbi:GntR family transcriptional regulator [Brucella pseudogrignonensis]|uniref:FadR/GntR family transcriptional regulator n=1 Tax=Brucella pseudogrignonensis TaxID=419475 RepID=UPI0028B7E4F6|nr:FCD domain-containing protein [Brucella pseudogrignonensis]MDT6941155.1 GntR family transcriptional regulator [Brucella pseudogrignonensis]